MKLKRVTRGDGVVLYDDAKEVLSIHESLKEGTIDIVLEGSLRSDTRHDFQDELGAFAVLGYDLRLNMEKVAYVSPSCIDALLKIQQMMDSRNAGSLSLYSIPAEILEKWKKEGYTEVLMIEE